MADIRWGWSGDLSELAGAGVAEIADALAGHHRTLTAEEPASSHFQAWRASLKSATAGAVWLAENRPESARWHVVFEYELPRERGRRPDMVLLAGDTIVVVEFKGYAETMPAHIDQVEAYVRDLGDYHAGSHGRRIVPVLCLTASHRPLAQDGETILTSAGYLGEALMLATSEAAGENAIDPESWLNADYQPLPSLVNAARIIFEHEDLPHIRRAESAGIPDTIAVLDRVADKARSEGESHLVLVTGVPGAGKTLVGLQFVYESHFGETDGQQAVFLSGNGPLVKVLQYTLSSRVFVQDVLGFLRSYGGNRAALPAEHIWVFDEAQRAFDAEMAQEKRGEPISEPEDFLRLGERLDSWALMVGLIGEGQEINRGEEAGITQWNDALGVMEKPWAVHCPPSLADVFSNASSVSIEPSLSLDTTLRSHRAEQIHEWVALLLDGRLGECKKLSHILINQGFEMYVTRDIEAARLYVRERYAGMQDARYGLLASSKARNLVEHGFMNEYQFTKNMRVGPWFADDPTSSYSCCALRDTATEFQCQGLELDMPIIGWGHDLWWTGAMWDCSTKYKVKNPRQIRLNAYRVLLTRGRDGFIVFVPPEPKYTPVFDALVEAGCPTLSRTWI